MSGNDTFKSGVQNAISGEPIVLKMHTFVFLHNRLLLDGFKSAVFLTLIAKNVKLTNQFDGEMSQSLHEINHLEKCDRHKWI